MMLNHDSKSNSRSLRRLRVLLIVESSSAGTGRHVCDLAEALLADGHDVHLIYSTIRMDSRFTFQHSGIRSLEFT